MYPGLLSSVRATVHCTVSQHLTLTLGGAECHCHGSLSSTTGTKSSTWQGSSSTFAQRPSCQTRRWARNGTLEPYSPIDLVTRLTSRPS